jgi:hypothetical protein
LTDDKARLYRRIDQRIAAEAQKSSIQAVGSDELEVVIKLEQNLLQFHSPKPSPIEHLVPKEAINLSRFPMQTVVWHKKEQVESRQEVQAQEAEDVQAEQEILHLSCNRTHHQLEVQLQRIHPRIRIL